jgi:hypothetical protein
MAAPNINAAGLIVLVDTLIHEATSAVTTVTSSTVAADHARRIDAIYASNFHATSIGEITVWHRKGGVDYPIATQERVPLRQKINVLIGGPLNMAEGDSLKVQANANSNVVIFAPYADMVD